MVVSPSALDQPPRPSTAPPPARPSLSWRQLARSHALRAAAALHNGDDAPLEEVIATAKAFARYIETGEA